VLQVTAESEQLETLLDVLRVQARVPGLEIGLSSAPTRLLREGPVEWRMPAGGFSVGGGSTPAASDGGGSGGSGSKGQLYLFLFADRLVVTTRRAERGGGHAYVATDPAHLGRPTDPGVKRRSKGGTSSSPAAKTAGLLAGETKAWKLNVRLVFIHPNSNRNEKQRPRTHILTSPHANVALQGTAFMLSHDYMRNRPDRNMQLELHGGLFFDKKFALEDAIGSHDCWFQASMRVLQYHASQASSFSHHCWFHGSMRVLQSDPVECPALLPLFP
jgi:hypothetical protein